MVGPGVNIKLGVDCIYEGCNCPGHCEHTGKSAACTCKCAYDEHGCVLQSYLEECSPPVMECNSRCTCGGHCHNRLSQKGCVNLQYLQVFPTEKKGFGVKSLIDLPLGSYVGEYIGEIISTVEADARLQVMGNANSCYILQYVEHLNNGVALTTNIDATHQGNITRFFNHSCHPNVAVVPVRSNSVLPRLCMFTCEIVGAEEELCFSYFGRKDLTADQVTVSVGTKPCVCGASNCVQYLPFNK